MNRIYVLILNEGIDVWRPVDALQISEGIYKIAESNQYDASDEEWEFRPGDIVLCQERSLDSRIELVAVKKCFS